jgi:hypothetical protein
LTGAIALPSASVARDPLIAALPQAHTRMDGPALTRTAL